MSKEKQNKIDEISKEFVQAVRAVYDYRRFYRSEPC